MAPGAVRGGAGPRFRAAPLPTLRGGSGAELSEVPQKPEWNFSWQHELNGVQVVLGVLEQNPCCYPS